MNYYCWGVINKKTGELEGYSGHFAVYSDRQSARGLVKMVNDYVIKSEDKLTVKKVLVTVID